MKKLMMLGVLAAFLAGCAAPKPPQPKGEWAPVNQPVKSGA